MSRRRTVPSGIPSRRANPRARQAFEEVEQHGRAVRLREREHLSGDHALQLDALDELGGRRDRPDAGLLVGRLALLAAGLATPARAREIPDDAREPRSERAVLVGPPRRGDEPRLLRDVGGRGVVVEQRASEPAHPAHLDHQLLAGWLHPHINCHRRAERSRNCTRTGSWRRSTAGSAASVTAAARPA